MQSRLWEEKARVVAVQLRARSSILESAPELHHHDRMPHKIPLHDPRLDAVHKSARAASNQAHHVAKGGKNKYHAHIKAAELHAQAAHQLGKAGYSQTAKLHHQWAHHHAQRATHHAPSLAPDDAKKPRHPGQAKHTASGEYRDIPAEANRARRIANAASRTTNKLSKMKGTTHRQNAETHHAAAELHTRAAQQMHVHGFAHQAHKHVTRAMRHMVKSTEHTVASRPLRKRPAEGFHPMK
jgi:hypothetical protein